MKHHVKITTIATLLVLEAAKVNAQQTNLVQDLQVRLAGISQGLTETNRNSVTTSLEFTRTSNGPILKQLGAATGNAFSDAARLVVVTPLPGGPSAIVVRDGSASVDVSSFFIYEVKSAIISNSQLNLRSGRGTETDYSIQRLALIDSPGYPALTLHFDVQGVAAQTSTSGPKIGTRNSVEASVSGAGNDGGNATLLEGTFRIDGATLEVVNNQPPPNA